MNWETKCHLRISFCVDRRQSIFGQHDKANNYCSPRRKRKQNFIQNYLAHYAKTRIEWSLESIDWMKCISFDIKRERDPKSKNEMKPKQQIKFVTPHYTAQFFSLLFPNSRINEWHKNQKFGLFANRSSKFSHSENLRVSRKNK